MLSQGLLLGALGAAVCLAFWLPLGASAAECLWLCGLWHAGVRRISAFTEPCVSAACGALVSRKGRAPDSVGLGDVSEMIDVVRLGLTAGLSFDAAVALYSDERDTALAGHLSRARLCWQMGVCSREEALAGVAAATGVRALESFAIAVTQALSLGAPLAETLEGQAKEIRSAHRAEVEREIERAPVKLLIPTGTLILPALLLSIVGPLLAASGMI